MLIGDGGGFEENTMADLLFGLETEYAIAGMTPKGPMNRSEILQAMMERARQQLVQLPDMHASAGFFLQNGCRFYADCGAHPEICTPETMNPWDLVRYTQAGHRILAALASSIPQAGRPEAEIMCFRCNVDYSGNQTTWGCHESYLHRMPLPALQPQVIPHLVSRLVYTGAGGFNPLSRGLEFTLSPRIAHLQKVVSGSSTNDRGIWHTKSESLSAQYNRLHVLCGESLCSETAAFLKAGATALVVALADAGLEPGKSLQLAEPLAAMQNVAADVTCKRPLKMSDGSGLTALAIQRRYLEQVEAHVGDSFMPDWAGEVCRRWRAVLDQLERAPGAVARTLDWGIKRALYAHQAKSFGLCWEALTFWNQVIGRLTAALAALGEGGRTVSLEAAIGPGTPIPNEIALLDPMVQSRGYRWEELTALLNCRHKFFEIDMRFGQLGSKGIFETLDRSGVLQHRVSGVDNIEYAMAEPPAKGRAHVRGAVIRRMAGSDQVQCDWQCIVNPKDGQMLDLSDPFSSEETWRPLLRTELRDVRLQMRLFQEVAAGGAFLENDCYTRREQAYQRYLNRDFPRAERLLRPLIEEGFEVPSTRCHLARSLIMMNRDAQARMQIDMAWAERDVAQDYVLLRLLFFKVVFAMLDGASFAGAIRQLRAGVSEPGHHSDWTIQPMLDHLRPRLGDENFAFLSALGKALSSGAAGVRLDEFPEWQPRRARRRA
jgi:proteasome accessory factor A